VESGSPDTSSQRLCPPPASVGTPAVGGKAAAAALGVIDRLSWAEDWRNAKRAGGPSLHDKCIVTVRTLVAQALIDHVGSKKVLTQRGEWQSPVLFGVLDDRSRLACPLQWYFTENAENIAQGLSQAFQRRGLPRSAQSDNGAAMTATEIVEGLTRLGILHQTTVPYSPYQNAKIETLWGLVEGRLLAMLEDAPDLTLAFFNGATLAWAEYEYNRKVHSEIGEAPIASFLAGPDVMRPSPDSATLKLTFTKADRRTQRSSDGTIVVEGNRFEVPNRYRHFTRIEIRYYASWDLAHIHLVDEHIGIRHRGLTDF
jgi:putative transposase